MRDPVHTQLLKRIAATPEIDTLQATMDTMRALAASAADDPDVEAAVLRMQTLFSVRFNAIRQLALDLRSGAPRDEIVAALLKQTQ